MESFVRNGIAKGVSAHRLICLELIPSTLVCLLCDRILPVSHCFHLPVRYVLYEEEQQGYLYCNILKIFNKFYNKNFVSPYEYSV